MSKGKSYILDNEYWCTICGKRGFNIARVKGRERESGHLKKLFCLYCNKQTNFCEIQPFSTKYNYEDFCIEFLNNNFDENGKRILEYGELKRLINNGKISDKTMDYVRDPGVWEKHLDPES